MCRERAYRDLQRTLHGIGTLPEPRKRANEALGRMFAAIQDMHTPSHKDFDEWHRGACEHLVNIYKECDYESFTVGHAQKWVNMTFKYIYMMGEQRLSGFCHLYDFCHVPLDNILMNALQRYDFQPLSCVWSKLGDYNIYLDRQRWVRSRFPLAPLDVEFLLWMDPSGAELNRRLAAVRKPAT